MVEERRRSSSAAEAPAPRVPRRLLILVFVAALLPRLWALDWGMPVKTSHIDEAVVVFYSLRAVSGDPNPRGFFDYPGFFLYALAALFKGALLAAGFFGHAVPPDVDVLDAYMKGDGLVFLLRAARFLNAALGAATAALLCRFGGAAGGRFAGVAAGLLWAVNPLAVAQGHYATVDMPAAFLFTAATDRMLRCADGGRRRDGLWAGALTGLAAATKYYPAVLALFLAAVPFLRRDKRALRRAALFVGTSAGVFLLASPYTLLEASAFAGRFAHLFPKIIGGGGEGTSYFLPTLKGLWSCVGLPALAAAAAGLVLLFRSSRRSDNLCAALALFMLVFLGLWKTQLPHYALPLYPLLFFAAARALHRTSRWGKSIPFAGLALLMAAALPPTGAYLRRISTPDTRLRALAWARETLPAGSRVLRFAHTPEFSPRDPFAVTVDWKNERLAAGVPALAADEADYLVHATYTPGRDPVPAALSGRFLLMKRFDDPPAEFPHHPAVSVYKVARE